MLNRSIQIEVSGNKYSIDFPNVGQYIEIENLKMSLTNGMYPQMALSPLKGAYFAIKLVDAISIFSVLVPKMREKLSGVKSYNDLDLVLGKQLVSVYEKQFMKWYQDWMNILLKDEEEIETGATE